MEPAAVERLWRVVETRREYGRRPLIAKQFWTRSEAQYGKCFMQKVNASKREGEFFVRPLLSGG
jgi:hypothetical protein